MHAAAVCQALARGVPLLTATRRLARDWLRRYDAFQAAQGHGVWPGADVLTLGAWLGRTHEELLDAGALGLLPRRDGPAGDAPASVLLSESQARTLWERIVAESPPARELVRGQALAARAREAWLRLAQWRLPLPVPGPGAPLEQRAFAAWARAYARQCAAQGWADPADVPGRVLAALQAGVAPVPERLLLAGFDDLTPQAAALLEALRAAGTRVDEVPHPRRGAVAVRTDAPDAEAEAWLAARWARHGCEAEPGARIAIVVPDLTSRRAQLVRVLEDVLLPTAVLPGHDGAPRPFNVSQGLALAEYPLVATALALLALTPAAQALETLSALLRSPFLAGAESEAAPRALLDLRVRGWGAAELAPASVQAAADAQDGTACPLLAAVLGRWRRAFDALPPRQAPSAWAQAFAGLLAALGWPGERSPDSGEFQTIEKWHGLLEELARLELVAPRMARGEALAALRRLAAETDFQPEGSEAPVQVLGLLESGGLEFDRLWVLGLHEEAWPAAPQPNPFLPLGLQRRHGMPRASTGRELDIARRETARLLQAAPDVVLSHPRAEGERPLRPSPLIRSLPAVTLERLPLATLPTPREALAAAAALEAFADDHAPPIVPGTPVAGGTGLFQDQAACPFRAFARHRLHARAPEAPGGGLDAAARGTLVHGALEQFWRRTGDQATLLALGAAALEATVAEAVEAAVAAFAEDRPQLLRPRMAGVERTRLVRLLRDWLALERQRAPFAVAQVEQRTPLEIGGISVIGRMDRLDRLPDGRHVLIDYKTGELGSRAERRVWWGERPDEPQLPLYAASAGLALAGVAFAQVRPQRMAFRGVVDVDTPADPPLFPGASRVDAIPPPPGAAAVASLEAAIAGWRVTLEALAERFRTGEAGVDPKRADTCRYCELPALCRIAERRPAYAAEEDGESGEGGESAGEGGDG